MTTVLIVVVVAVIVVVAVAWWLTQRSRNADGVDSFRRQIDALSPQARRSTVEQLNLDPQPQPDATPDEPNDDDPDAPHDPDDPQGGAHGS